jgi:hypothetical protein
MLEGADYPLTGWRVGDKLIHPPAAYMEMECWLSHFEATFPDKAKKMHEYSQKKGWSQQAHGWYWPVAILGWLQKTAPSNAEVTGAEGVRWNDGFGGAITEKDHDRTMA